MSEKLPETSFHQHDCHLETDDDESTCQLGYAIVPRVSSNTYLAMSIFVDVVNVYNQLTLSGRLLSIL